MFVPILFFLCLNFAIIKIITMKNYRNILCASIIFAGMLFLGTGCTSSQKQTADLPRISFKDYLGGNDKVAIGSDEIESIEYIPLELTDDDASLVGYIQDIVLAKQYIFVLSIEENKVLQFDRQGKYIRTVTRQGEGPGELPTLALTMWTDDAAGKLYVSTTESISVYSYDGTFEWKADRHGRMVAYAGGRGMDWVAETSRENSPSDSPWIFGMGAFRYRADGSCDTLYMKKDVGNASAAPSETCYIMGCFFRCADGYRYHVACNDTLFTLTEKGIEPYLILDRKPSSEEEKKYYLSPHQDFHPDMIYTQYMCETPRRIYVRFIHNETFYLLSYEKETGEILCQKTKYNFQNIKDYDGFMTCPGIENEVNGGLPIWFRNNWNPQTNIAIQPTSAATIAWMKEEGMIKNLPDFLQDYPEDGNPVVAVYHFK